MSRRRRTTVTVIAVAVLVALAGAVLLTLVDGPWNQGAQSGGPEADAIGAVPAFTVPDGPASIVPVERIAVEASSELPPDGAITYQAVNTIDGDPTTAWNSSGSEDQGRGEKLGYRFSQPIDLKAIRFVNGYAKNPDIFAANHRLQTVMITTDSSTRTLSLLDTSDPQEISFDFGLTSKVVLDVVEVYPGQGFDNPSLSADLALSEISFLAVQG